MEIWNIKIRIVFCFNVKKRQVNGQFHLFCFIFLNNIRELPNNAFKFKIIQKYTSITDKQLKNFVLTETVWVKNATYEIIAHSS